MCVSNEKPVHSPVPGAFVNLTPQSPHIQPNSNRELRESLSSTASNNQIRSYFEINYLSANSNESVNGATSAEVNVLRREYECQNQQQDQNQQYVNKSNLQ